MTQGNIEDLRHSWVLVFMILSLFIEVSLLIGWRLFDREVKREVLLV